MIICKYERLISKNGKPFRLIKGDKEFRSTSELEARRVVQRWNVRGNFARDVKWRYNPLSFRLPTREEFDMTLYTESDC